MQQYACAPHAMDFAACCITDRELSLAPTPPGPCELSHGHALGPSARRVGVNLLPTCGSPTFARNPQASRPDIVAATASRSAQRDVRETPLPSERDRAMIVVLGGRSTAKLTVGEQRCW